MSYVVKMRQVTTSVAHTLQLLFPRNTIRTTGDSYSLFMYPLVIRTPVWAYSVCRTALFITKWNMLGWSSWHDPCIPKSVVYKPQLWRK